MLENKILKDNTLQRLASDYRYLTTFHFKSVDEYDYFQEKLETEIFSTPPIVTDENGNPINVTEVRRMMQESSNNNKTLFPKIKKSIYNESLFTKNFEIFTTMECFSGKNLT